MRIQAGVEDRDSAKGLATWDKQLPSWAKTVIRDGWSEKLQRKVLTELGGYIRVALITELRRRFGGDAIRGLSGYLQKLQEGRAAQTGGTPAHLLDLACNTWQAVWMEIFKEEGNTIHQYQLHLERSEMDQRSPMKFESYLWGLVSLKLRQQLPLHKRLFNPEVNISGDDSEEESWEERLESDTNVSLSDISLADDADLYWEGLLLCGTPNPDEAEKELELRNRKDHLLCWVCCSIKQGVQGSKRENILAFLTFFLSHRGTQRRSETLPERNGLSLSMVTGRYFRWEEDVCTIFGKDIRKDRVIAQIQKKLLDSRYREQVE